MLHRRGHEWNPFVNLNDATSSVYNVHVRGRAAENPLSGSDGKGMGVDDFRKLVADAHHRLPEEFRELITVSTVYHHIIANDSILMVQLCISYLGVFSC